MARSGVKTIGLLFVALVAGTDSFSFQRRTGLSSSGVSVGPRTPKTMCLRAKDKEENEEAFEVQTWNPLRLLVLRLGLTEPVATSPLNYGKYDGEFTCAYCGSVLFDSNAKYDSGSGWPSFWRTANENAMEYKMEFDSRLECKCKRCSRYESAALRVQNRRQQLTAFIYVLRS
jgi:peptide methionine sulfoxide reductase MsrB